MKMWMRKLTKINYLLNIIILKKIIFKKFNLKIYLIVSQIKNIINIEEHSKKEFSVKFS